MENSEPNLLLATKKTLSGLSDIFTAIRKMPDDPRLTQEQREQARETLKNSKLEEAEASLKESIMKLAKMATPQ